YQVVFSNLPVRMQLPYCKQQRSFSHFSSTKIGRVQRQIVSLLLQGVSRTDSAAYPRHKSILLSEAAASIPMRPSNRPHPSRILQSAVPNLHPIFVYVEFLF